MEPAYEEGTACPVSEQPEKEPEKKQGKWRRIKRIALAAGMVFLLLLTVYTVYRYQTMHAEYGDVWKVEITQQDVEDMQRELDQLTDRAAGTQAQAEQVRLKAENMEKLLCWYDGDEHKEEEILELVARNIEIVDEAKSLIMESFGYQIQVHYESADAEKEWRDDVIGDLAGNSLISSGIIGGLDAAENEVSAGSILNGIKNGIASGVPSFATDKAKDALSNVTGSGVVSAASLLSDILSLGNVPELLVNYMVDLQNRYSIGLRNFIELEKVTPEDISQAADYYYQMYQIRDQVAEVTDAAKSNMDDVQNVYRQLKELAREYQSNNTRIALYVGED